MGLVFYWPFMAQNMRNDHVRAEAAAVAASLSKTPKSGPNEPRKPISGVPVRIIVPAIGLDLPVIQGVYEPYSNTWQISQTKANFASNTQPSNTKSGTTLIYGHDTSAIFSSLKKLNVGDTALVYTENDHIFSYSLVSNETVKPTNTSILTGTESGQPTLALLTCDGYWSQNRMFLYFKLDQAK